MDIIHFGELADTNRTKLQGFVNKVNNENSHYVCLEPSLNALSDCLLETPVVGSSSGGGGNTGGDLGNLGFDPNMDPELAMAIRISLEEARAQEKKDEGEGEVKPEEEKVEEKAGEGTKMETENVEKGNTSGNENQPAVFSQPKEDDLYDDEDMDSEEILKKAMELSLQDAPNQELKDNAMQEEKTEEKTEDQAFQDPSFVNELLNSVGIDPNDPKMKEALEKMTAGSKEKDNNKMEEEEKKK